MYKSKKQYLATLRKLGNSLPPLDTKAARKEFRATSHLIYNEYIEFGLECWITYKTEEAYQHARGGPICANLEANIRDDLAWNLARLKYDGIAPPKHILKLASLFDIKGWEIDGYREYCDCISISGHGVNLPIPPEGLSPVSAQVIAFPADKVASVAASKSASASPDSAALAEAEVIAFPARRIVRKQAKRSARGEAVRQRKGKDD